MLHRCEYILVHFLYAPVNLVFLAGISNGHSAPFVNSMKFVFGSLLSTKMSKKCSILASKEFNYGFLKSLLKVLYVSHNFFFHAGFES